MIKVIPELSEKDKARFWSCVAIASPDECWRWIGTRGPHTYGKISFRHVSYLAHRVALTLWDGPFTASAPYTLHSCDNPPCCNPMHLSWGTHRQNMEDALARNRTAAGNKNGTRTKPHRTPKGASHYRTRLTDVQALEIRNSTGKLVEDAEKYGLCMSTIHAIRTRRTWRHLP